MKVSEQWLREWVNTSNNAQELASLLTMAGLEVDAINPVAGQFDKVIVAQVLKTTPHPQADKLTLCDVDTGSGNPIKVVCGASNVRAGLKVALAQIGANLPNGLLIKESVLRGEVSQGMLCSASELGLTDSSDGIIELDADAPIGQDFRIYWTLDDQVLDIDLTPNRADCLSIQGIAREIAALTHSAVQALPSTDIQPLIDDQLVVRIEAKDACPQYCGRIIRGLNPHAKTPLWMRERLRRAGIRAIYPIVDVTNYVMLELGQPMHAFDLKQIEGNILARFAKKDETLTLLDGQDVVLTDDVLVIADTQKALAIAGVMGGADSGVMETTTDVFLESAFFSPEAIAGVARRYGLVTDSSQRFERGVDPSIQETSLNRATSLLLSIAGGEAGPVTMVSHPQSLPQKITILFNPGKVKQLTGLQISEPEMMQMLKGLGMTVESQQSLWKVTVPSYRFDMALDVDLIEEIVRLYGYDRIPGEKMVAQLQAGKVNPEETLANHLAAFFNKRGYHETINYSFVDPELQQVLFPDVQAKTLLNPISSELSQMRVSLWPGLIASAVHNIHRQQNSIKFFENGVVFDVLNGQVQEQPCFAGLLIGSSGSLNWLAETRPFDFYDAKGDLQALLASLNWQDIEFIACGHPALHPGKSAQIKRQEQVLGWCGVLHPRIAEALDLNDEVILFELKTGLLINPEAKTYKPISKFPQIRRDLSLIVDEQITAAAIEGLVRETVNPLWLKSFDIFDVYKGKSIPEGKKSLALALTLQDDARTLIDNEINELISAIIKKLEQRFNITLRD